MTTHTHTETFVVGGAVRDTLLGRPVKDMDFVVVGSTPEEMLADGFQQVGADFPVFLDEKGQEFALARTERKIGSGYHGFETDFDPSVTLRDDLFRRDLTVNSMAVNRDNWEKFQETRSTHFVIDPFNGMQDLESGLLRHVSDAFAEDPVRVLRVARFAARYNFSVSTDTLKLMAQLTKSGELDELTPERVFAELEKAVMEDFPMQFFMVLHDVNALDVLFPELFDENKLPIQTNETLDRAVLLFSDFIDRMVILAAGSNTEQVLNMLERLKAPRSVKNALKMSCTMINDILDHSNDFDTAEGFIKVLDKVHAWKLPTTFHKTATTLIIFDNHFIHSIAFKFLKMFKAGIVVEFEMLTTGQKERLEGKQIGEAIEDLRKEVLRKVSLS